MDPIINIVSEPAPKYYPKMTPEEYLEWESNQPEKHEYFDGEIFPKFGFTAMAGASINHNYVYSNLFIPIGMHLKDKPCDVFGSDLRVQIKTGNAYCYPDITVVCDQLQMANEKPDMITNPAVIIEILSPSTEQFDIMKKKFFYMQISSLQEYIMISPSFLMIDVFRRTQENFWENEILSGTDNTLYIQSIDLRISLTEIFKKVQKK